MAEPMDTTPTEEEITKPDITSSGELDAANNVLVSHHYKLRKSLNFSKIHPLLNEHHLLPRDNPGDFVSLLPPVSNDDQIDKLVKCLTSSNNPQYLRRLIDCLRQTAHHVGAHDELADTLERALDEELANPSAKKVTMEESKSGGTLPEPDMMGGLEPPQSSILKRICSWRWVSCYVVTSFLLVLGLISVIVLSVHPSREVAHLSPTILRLQDVTEMQLSLPYFWLSSGTLSFNKRECAGTGKVHVFRGKSCEQLNITTVKNVTRRDLGSALEVFYLLPGSTINMLDVDTTSAPTDLVFWITSTFEAFRKLRSLRETSDDSSLCTSPNPFPGAYCFVANDYVGRSISFRINVTGYYRFDDHSSICSPNCYSLLVTSIQYDISLPTELIYSVFSIANEAQNVIDFTIMEPWQFYEQNCVLVQSDCTSTNAGELDSNVSVSVQRRIDILLFPGLALIVAVLITSTVVLVHCVCVIRRRKRKENVS